jgi:hypothetical protein
MGIGRGTSPLCRATKILLSCPETTKLCMSEELARRKIINCTNKTHIINLGKYLDKVGHKWEKCEKNTINNYIQL